MLDNKSLQELNILMVGRGAPIEKDDAGYNIADFNVMLGLSFTPAEALNDLMSYAIAKTLYSYANTQLTEYKAELKETIDYYSNKISTTEYDFNPSLFKNENRELVREYKDRIKKEKSASENVLDIVREDVDGITVKFTGYISALKDKVSNLGRDKARWVKNESEWNLFIANSEIATIYNVFKDNYYSNARLDSIVMATEEYINEKMAEYVPDTYYVHVKRNGSLCYSLDVEFEPDSDNKGRELNLWDIRGEHSTWKKDRAKSILRLTIPVKDIITLYKELESNTDYNFILDYSNKIYTRVLSFSKNSYNLCDVKKISTLPFSLYDFQIEDCKKMIKAKKYLNANEMGCGKTMQGVLVGHSLKQETKLIICPATLRLNWEREIRFVEPDADITIIRDKNSRLSKEWNIVSYNGLKSVSELLEDVLMPNCVIIDEAHNCKAVNSYGEPSSQRAKGVMRLCATADFVYPLTGTPKPNNNKDLYNILRMIDCSEIMSKDIPFLEYGKEYCDGEETRFGWKFDGNSNNNQLNEILKKYMVRHTKKQVLPHLKKQRSFIPLECDLRKYEKAIESYVKERLEKGEEVAESGLGHVMMARRMLSLVKAMEAVSFISDLLEQGESVVFIDSFTETLTFLKEKFEGQFVCVEGGMSDKAKQKAVDDFQSGKAKLFLGNIKAAGVGITLTKSHILLINSFEWLPADMTQAEDRICRGNQTEVCLIYYLYAKGADMDELFVLNLTDKFKHIDATVDGGMGDNFNMKQGVLDAIYQKRAIKNKA